MSDWKTAVVALGGNALLNKEDEQSIDSQFRNMERAAESIERLSKKYRLVLTHGNGPQVGNILIRSEEALGKAYPIPLHVAVAESEGEIGYIMQQVLQNKLRKTVVSITTQVLVDADDPGFNNPTKPVGPFYDKSQSEKLEADGLEMQHVSGGYRRVVTSPRPIEIIEADAIADLVEHGFLVIAAGGGGVPVVENEGGIHGVDAVIDKDLASACLARSLGADVLFLLTDTDGAYLDYGSPDQRKIEQMTAKEAKAHMADGHFKEGSMKPKVEACIQFVSETGGVAYISSLDAPEDGTLVTR